MRKNEYFCSHQDMKYFKFTTLTIALLAILIALASCNHHTLKRYDEIDALIERNHLDSAETALKLERFDDSEYSTSRYSLLVAKLAYRQSKPLNTDTLLDNAIKFFKSEDESFLAECYYYKGAFLCDEGNYKDGLKWLKMSESAIGNQGNLSTRHKIIEKITDINLSAGEYNIALDYAMKNLKVASLSGNDDWMAYAYVFLSQAYKGVGNHDEAQSCLDKCMKFVEGVPSPYRADFYVYIANSLMPDDLDAAQKYVDLAQKCSMNESVYGTSARLSFLQGNIAKADSLWRFALKSKNPEHNVLTYQMMIDMYVQTKDFEKACSLYSVKEGLERSTYTKRQEDNVRNIQAKYDYEFEKQRFRQKIYSAIPILIIVVAIVIMVYLYNRYKAERISKTVAENQLLINIYKKKIEDLSLSNTDKSSELTDLKKKLSDFNDKQSQILYYGKCLYERIQNGETVVSWNKNDFCNFIEYYKLIDFPYVFHLETDYDHLSPRYVFFMILEHMGKDIEELERILGISYNTVRSTKSRIKNKKLVEDE